MTITVGGLDVSWEQWVIEMDRKITKQHGDLALIGGHHSVQAIGRIHAQE